MRSLRRRFSKLSMLRVGLSLRLSPLKFISKGSAKAGKQLMKAGAQRKTLDQKTFNREKPLKYINECLSRSRQAVLSLLITFAGVAGTSAYADARDPQRLEEVNIARTIASDLQLPDNLSELEQQQFLEAKPSIARTLLLLSYTTLSVGRLKTILKWEHTSEPEFAPGLLPGAGTYQPTLYLSGRARNWRLHADGTVSLDVIWFPFSRATQKYYLETQWYRKDGNAWYLFKQERREMAGCNKWPRCIADES